MKGNSLYLILAQALFLLSCGGDKGSVTLDSLGEDSESRLVFWGSCWVDGDSGDLKTCHQWYGHSFANIPLSSFCKNKFSGKYSNEFCPRQNNVGTCRISQFGELESMVYYFEEGWDSELGKEDCLSRNSLKESHWLPNNDFKINP